MAAPTGPDDDASLAGRRIAVPEARQLDVLANLLERRGAEVLRCPLVDIADAPDPSPVVAWIERRIAAPDDLIVLYTGEGVERLLRCARRAGLEAQLIAALGRSPKLTRGPKPKRALKRIGLTPEHEPSQPTTAGLIAALAGIELPRRRAAVQLYDAAQDPALLEALRARGVEPDTVAPYVYASAADGEHVAALIEALAAGRIDAIAFTSTAQVQRLAKLARERGLEEALGRGLAQTRVAAVGPVVAAALERAGVRVDALPEHNWSMKPLVRSLTELLR